MARYCGSVCRLCRREGEKLFLKGERCFTGKCAVEKREGGPGQHGRGRQAFSNYKIQLREKQKVKRLYGLLEKQFSNLMAEASRKQGQSGENLLQLLERRMDNAVYRSGLAVSRRAARQLVTHGHFHLNGRRVDIPSIRMKEGDVLVLRDTSKKNEYFKHIDDVSPASPDTVPTWMKVNRKKFEITITGIPARDDAEPEINEQLIVEYYSR